jgi:hypothetical protein
MQAGESPAEVENTPRENNREMEVFKQERGEREYMQS